MSPVVRFSTLLSGVREGVDQLIDREWSAAISAHSGDGKAIVDPLRAAQALCLRGGKRLRAGLVAAAYCAVQPEEGSHEVHFLDVVQTCAAVELLQSYFLIHDDWMDGDLQRRGGPAVHAHLAGEWNSEHLGAAGGVLAGDYTLALGSRLLATAPETQCLLPAALGQFAQMQLDAVAGQLLDVLDPAPNIERVYELKTGSYTVVGPLRMGVLLGGASRDWFPELEQYGQALGIAFQLQDDLLGLFGQEENTGKLRGGDLKSGKQTLLFQTAMAMLNDAGRRRLQEGFGNPAATPQQLSELVSLVEASGARKVTEQRVVELVSEARNVVETSPGLSHSVQLLLLEIAASLTERSS